MIQSRRAAVGRQLTWIVAAMPVVAIGVGWMIAEGDVKVVAAAAVITALLVLAARAPGPLAVLLLLAALNGIPIVNLSGRLPGGAHVQDGAVIALGALLYAYPDRNPTPERARLIRMATVWGAFFVAFWAFTLARSELLGGVTWLKAALYGRDFLYFALLLPLALRARLPSASVRAGAWVLLAGVVVYSVGATVVSVTGHTLPWLIHPGILDPNSGVTRLYASMSPLVNTSLVFAAALLLSRSSCGRRGRIGALVLLLALTAALQLTRANYFALAVAFVAGVCVATIRSRAVMRLVVCAGIATLVVTAGLLTLSISGRVGGHAVGVVVSRAEAGISDLSHSSGSVGYRETVDREMLHVLGTSWPLGLSFLNPVDHYVSSLPSGSIRNSDTGVFNVLMTMGVLGALLVYAPLLYGIRELMRASRRGVPERLRWVVAGGAAWIAWAVAGSPTLGVLFGTTGLVVTALVLAVLAGVTAPPALIRS